MTTLNYADLFAYDAWPSRKGQGWGGDAAPGASPYDNMDFHVDLGCGKLPKGRIGVDRYAAPGVSVIADLNNGVTYGLPRNPGEDALVDGQVWNGLAESDYMTFLAGGELRSAYTGNWRLPFEDNSIESIISHHFFEHVGDGFMALVDDIYRVLVPGGILRAITPLFPSWSAVSDPDHRRYFMAEDGGWCTWDSFCGTPEPGGCWLESFSVPYSKARFRKLDQDMTGRSPDPSVWWTSRDCRELRVALAAVK